MRKLLAIFAHPDDEGVVAGTMARYARNNTEVMLICATKGEEGQISDPALSTSETLGAVREAELRAACETIGVHQLHFLGYRDSGMKDTPANQKSDNLIQADEQAAIGRLVALIRKLQPDVVITFEPVGWYGHPDHVAVHRLATAAYDCAGEGDAYPAAGPAWQPKRLFYAVLPISRFQTLNDYAKANDLPIREWDPQLVEQLQTIEGQVTHMLDVADMFETKTAAMSQHRTQFGEDHPFRRLPEEITRQMWGKESFILARPIPGAAPAQQQTNGLFEED
jgi:LmbE family N-acetylglucosaminyl deacetylase